MTDDDKAQAGSDVKGSKRHAGSCHCGAVRFEVELDLGQGGGRCNCSICVKISSFNTIVKPAAFRLLSGEDALGVYEWGAKVSRRYFCKQCGVHCFGRGHLAELGGDFVSVSLNALDGVELAGLNVVYWDGRHNNWHAGPRDTPWPIVDRAPE
jgi:hypothetical protein